MIQKFSKFFNKNWMVIVLLFILSIPALLKLIMPGFYEPHDLHHFADIYQMFRAFSSGQLPPRWGPDFLYNFGYPLFNFYYVMPFYMGALFLKLSGSIQLAFKLVFISSILIGVYGMYLLLREFTGKLAAVAGSIIFLYTPYRAVQIYVRGAIGEALSLALTPLAAYAFIKVIKNPGKLKYIAIAGITGAIFILSHNYMWALSLPWIITLALTFIEKKTFWKSIWSLLISGILMLGISAYWWVPAIIEQKLVAATTPFPLIDHFPFIKQLIIPSWGHGPSIPGLFDDISFQIGIINLIGIIVVIVLLTFFRKLFKDKKLFRISIWGIVSFFIIFFMMNIRSYPIWKILPFHDFVQFPWRLLSFTTLFTAILIAVSIELFKKNTKVIVGLVLIFGAIVLTFNYFQPSHTVFKSDTAYLSRFFAYSGVVSQDYKNYSEDYLLLPDTTNKKPDFLPSKKIISNSGIISDINEVSTVNWSANVASSNGTRVTFYELYFPGWYAKVDDKVVNIASGRPYGQIEIDVPRGIHKVNFYWAETPLRKTASVVSLVLVLASLIFVFKPPRVTLKA